MSGFDPDEAIQEWKSNKHHFPLYKSDSELEKFWSNMGYKVQPLSHVPRKHLPPHMFKLGAKLWIPKDTTAIRNMAKSVGNRRNAQCKDDCDKCKGYVPRFFYTFTDKSCWRAEKDKTPTVFAKFSHTEVGDTQYCKIKSCQYCIRNTHGACEFAAITSGNITLEANGKVTHEWNVVKAAKRATELKKKLAFEAGEEIPAPAKKRKTTPGKVTLPAVIKRLVKLEEEHDRLKRRYTDFKRRYVQSKRLHKRRYKEIKRRVKRGETRVTAALAGALCTTSLNKLKVYKEDDFKRVWYEEAAKEKPWEDIPDSEEEKEEEEDEESDEEDEDDEHNNDGEDNEDNAENNEEVDEEDNEENNEEDNEEDEGDKYTISTSLLVYTRTQRMTPC